MNFQTWQSKFETQMRLRRLAESTIENYLSFNIKFLVCFKDYPDPKHVPVSEIEQYLLGFTSATDQKQATASVKKFYEVAVRQPDRLKKIPFPKINSALPDIIERGELEKKIERVDDVRYKAIFTLMYKTGLRVTECASLKVSDLNFADGIITVRCGKGGKPRRVPFGNAVLINLIPYLRQRKVSEYLFHGEKAKNYISTSIIEKKCRELLNVHPHQLRHCHSVHYLENGGDIYSLKELLGHSRIESTQRYARMTNTLLKNALTIIERAA